jgi:L-threonylcarbamoyladenylate synthase
MILKPTPENISLAVELLKKGDVIGMPTETVYGLAASIDNADALVKVFSVKNRPHFDPLIVHVPKSLRDIEALAQSGLVDAKALTASEKELVNKLLSAFWPGPLTLVLPKGPRIQDLITSGLPTVALRMPKHPVSQSLIQGLGIPLAAPSANRFGKISPTNAEHVDLELGKHIPFVLDGDSCEIGLESTVVSLMPIASPSFSTHSIVNERSANKLTLLRPGGVPTSEIEKICGYSLERLQKPILDSKLQNATQSHGTDASPQISPGMLASHYAPEKKLFLLPETLKVLSDRGLESFVHHKFTISPTHLGLLMMSGEPKDAQERLETLLHCKVTARSLSIKGDLQEAARNLFQLLRELDLCDATCLISEPCLSEVGLGHAIADRLKRASA